MRKALVSLGLSLLGFLVVGWGLHVQLGFELDIIAPILAAAFGVWLIGWLFSTFRWPMILAPTAIAYWMFAFQGADRSVMVPGLIGSAALFVLTTLAIWIWGTKPSPVDNSRK